MGPLRVDGQLSALSLSEKATCPIHNPRIRASCFIFFWPFHFTLSSTLHHILFHIFFNTESHFTQQFLQNVFTMYSHFIFIPFNIYSMFLVVKMHRVGSSLPASESVITSCDLLLPPPPSHPSEAGQPYT